jgi:hypothetical protein
MQTTGSISNNMPDAEFVYMNDWFDSVAKNVWESLIPQIKPKRILEVGSYEGASVCYPINKLAQESPIEIHCIDTWQGGVEHQTGGIDMASVERRFHHNTKSRSAGRPTRLS